MPHIFRLLTYNRSEEIQDKTNHSGGVEKEVCESVESFIRAIQSDAQFVGAMYSLVEQSSLKVKGPDLWLRLCSLNSLSIVHDQTIAVRTKKSFGFNSFGRFGYFGRFETCREYLAAEARRAWKNSIDFHSIKHLSPRSAFTYDKSS